MNNFLNNIRKPIKNIKTSKKVINSLIILFLGIILGIFSKWLDNLAIDDLIWWQHLLGLLDLRNVFSEFAIWLFIALCISVYSKSPIRACLNVFLFFLGMCVSYHLYTIIFSGFNPRSYMMIWYIITCLSLVPAFISWYSKGTGKISLVISSIIVSIMFLNCFSIGFWYLDIKSLIYIIIFLGTIVVLHNNYKNSLIAICMGIVIAYLIRVVI